MGDYFASWGSLDEEDLAMLEGWGVAFRAEFWSKCTLCGDQIEPGDTIRRERVASGPADYAHDECAREAA